MSFSATDVIAGITSTVSLLGAPMPPWFHGVSITFVEGGRRSDPLTLRSRRMTVPRVA
jgi:hypothetical protein